MNSSINRRSFVKLSAAAGTALTLGLGRRSLLAVNEKAKPLNILVLGGTQLLCLGYHVEGQGRLAAGLRTVDLDHPAAWHAADAQRQVERHRARRYHLDVP